MQYTIDEHFVSRFIINRFSDSQEQVGFINIKQKQPVLRTTKSTAICFRKNMYEIKNVDGSYFERNCTEKRYAAIEAELSSKLEPMIVKLHLGGILSAEDNAYLTVLFALQLVRTPMLKRVVFKKDGSKQNVARQLEQNSIYKMMIDSVDVGIQYLLQNGFAISDEVIRQIRNTANHQKSMVDEVMQYIQRNCSFYFITTQGHPFLLSDNPVLIDKFENTKYIFPIDPRHAIICAVRETDKNMDWGCLNRIPDDTVDKINLFSIQNADNLIVCHPDNQTYYLALLQRRIHQKDDQNRKGDVQ